MKESKVFVKMSEVDTASFWRVGLAGTLNSFVMSARAIFKILALVCTIAEGILVAKEGKA